MLARRNDNIINYSLCKLLILLYQFSQNTIRTFYNKSTDVVSSINYKLQTYKLSIIVYTNNIFG